MPALRQFIVWKGGERNADDIVQQVLVKLVDVLRTGQYKAEKGRFHSYLAMMAYNEVHMQHRKDQVRHVDEHVPIDNFVNDGTHDDQQIKFETPDELKAQDAPAGESLDSDWQRAVVEAARDHVLNKTALSDRDPHRQADHRHRTRDDETERRVLGLGAGDGRAAELKRLDVDLEELGLAAREALLHRLEPSGLLERRERG